MRKPTTITTLLIVFAMGACGSQKKSGLSVTPAGILAHFGFAALSPGQPLPPGHDVTKVLRCTFLWQDNADESFVVDISTTSRTAPEGVSLIDIRMNTIKSNCELVGRLTAPAIYYEVAGKDEAKATVRVTYTCPSGEGSGGIVLSTVNPPEVVFSGMKCVNNT
ncbi:MAG: hypothetical protein JKY56_22505 [Kofleriaceae bacterium]|nr:hypothetical protein [Kofleriaceae bacterium]